MTWVLAVVIGSVLAPISGVATAATTPLTPTDLGTLATYDDFNHSRALDVDGNIVVGVSQTTAGGMRAFAYEIDTATMEDLGTLDTEDQYGASEANGVSGNIVAGYTDTATGGEAFAYDLTTGTMTGLGALPGGERSYGYDVDGDIVVGESDTADESNRHAFAYDLTTDTMTDLGVLREDGEGWSSAKAISGNIVVGNSAGEDWYEHAFAYDLTTGEMKDLGLLPGMGSSVAYGVSGNIVVGESWTAGGAINRGFFYDLETDTMTEIGTFLPDGTGYSSAADVDGRTVVGIASLASPDPGYKHAFAYDLDTGEMTELGSLLPDGTGWSTAYAVDGDNVVGFADQPANSSYSHATLWTLVSDVTAPMLTAPDDMFVQYKGRAGSVAVTFAATATDDVDGEVPVVCDPASGDLFPLGTTTVTCTATDAAGNVATDTFKITVKRGFHGGLSLTNGRHGRDVALVTAPSSAAGATVNLYKVRPTTGRRVLLAAKPANSSGDARFVVADRRPQRTTTYVAYVSGTRRSLPDWTPRRSIR